MLANNELDSEILQQIRDASYDTLLNGKDKNGIPFLKQIFRLHLKIFGQTCSNCPAKIAGYIQKLKKFNPTQMETTKENTQKFQLKSEALIIIPGSSKSYSNANLTDEIALDYLSKNVNRKQIFAKLPEDIDELIANHIAGTPEAKAPKVVKLEVDGLVGIGETRVTVEVAVSLLDKVNVKTKATSVAGVEKVIKALDADTEQALVELAKGTVTGSEASEETERAELQLAYDNAQEAFTNLPADASDETKAEAEKLVADTEKALVEFDEKANQ